eukprot:CAMPEP_0182487038 /NCGR_PEP_ID=MMETSP1319-20130603/47698_1 /TAXON_ID=172717 /ORGANISM="Bolidomonas pacifica, Strain RCC208" /LENGTH=185 /DNA_ID=CAMNT_0024689147 /DNA_START=844 /DNA_END=1398 /DNA_ORIENTATION=-
MVRGFDAHRECIYTLGPGLKTAERGRTIRTNPSSPPGQGGGDPKSDAAHPSSSSSSSSSGDSAPLRSGKCTLLVSTIKKKSLRLVVEKATELRVSSIVVCRASHSRAPEPSSADAAKLTRVAEEATVQSEGFQAPDVSAGGGATVLEALASMDARIRKLVCVERGEGVATLHDVLEGMDNSENVA